MAKVDSLTRRQKQCIEVLKEMGELTAREVSEFMYAMGFINVIERNASHPRLCELIRLGLVTIVEKRSDEKTGKTVSVYKLSDQQEKVA